MIIPTMCQNNCGGRCQLYVHTQENKIEKITTDASEGSLKNPPLTACARGLNAHNTFLDESQRLLYPMIRTGERGSGEFRRASWDEAIDLIASEWIRIRDTYGPESRYVHYGWGVSALLNPVDLAKRLLALDGGFLNYYNSYSTACISYTTPYLYGTGFVGNSFDDLLNSSLIVLWGHNPAETRFDTLMYYLRKARDKGIPIICVDPRYSDTARQLHAEWIKIRPTTDSALIDAMSYVIIEEDLYDKHCVFNMCQGFTKDTMPEGYEQEEDYFSYVKGLSDGVEKTPEWAETITGIPADIIRSFARRYALAPSAALLPGYGPQRNINGEQTTRSAILLSCLTGNVGKSGGSSGGDCWIHPSPAPVFPKAHNPYPARIPVYLWTKAIEDGIHMGKDDGVIGVPQLKSSIKMILNLAGNALINQHGNIHYTEEVLKDTSKCEFIVCSDVFLTPSAKFADVVLPSVSFFELNNITTPWVQGNFIGAVNKIIEPLGECRFEYDWLKEIARRLDLYDSYTEGHNTADEWVEDLCNDLRFQHPELPSYKDFREKGIYRWENLPTQVAFEQQREDPSRFPFPTPSGKIEIFSPTLFELDRRDVIPGIPKYVPAVIQNMSLSDTSLQIVGYHTKRRCHSIHDSNKRMEHLDPQTVHMNPLDAENRNISSGDLVVVENSFGSMKIKAVVSEDIMPGVAAIAQGAWYTPDDRNIDIRGNINVLTTDDATPLAHGNPQHTIFADIRKCSI